MIHLPDPSDKPVHFLIFLGTQHHKGEPVYPLESIDEDTMFPDGSPMNNHGDPKPPYVFVWKTCGTFIAKTVSFGALHFS